MKKLPIGIDDFSILRAPENDYIYVDKTMYIHHMVVEKCYFCVCINRPHHFGKSLLISTMQALFEGRQELFRGLYIEDKWNFQEKHPVIKISFPEGNYQTESALQEAIELNIQENEKRLGVETKSDYSPNFRMHDLIDEAYRKYNQRVVVLIDGYDRPLLDVLNNPQQLEAYRRELWNFYAPLKGSARLEFAFLAGMGNFTSISIFSGLNNILNLGLDSDYAAICGFTQAELERDFAEYLDGVNPEEMRYWYSGYSFSPYGPEDRVYAPYDVLSYLNNRDGGFKSHWFENTAPKTLENVLKQRVDPLPIQSLEKAYAMIRSLYLDTRENISLGALLYQMGYLTLLPKRDVDGPDILRLRIPNQSVRVGLAMHLISALSTSDEAVGMCKMAKEALLTGNLSVVCDHWNRLFASTRYDTSKVKDFEVYYRDIAYTYCLMLRLDTHAEEYTSDGRIDLRVSIQDRLYLFEFEKKGGVDPISQIRAKGYADKFHGQFTSITLVGVTFNLHPDSAQGEGIVQMKWEAL